LNGRDVPRLLRCPHRCIANGGSPVRPRLTQPCNRVERRPTRVGQVGIGTVLEQRGRKLEVGIDRCNAQRARAVRRNVVDVGTVFQQRKRRLNVSVANRKQQRREAAVGFQREVSACLEEHIDCGGITLSRGPHQRGLAFIRFLGIDLRATRQQQPDRICLSRQRGGHQHRLTFLRSAVRIGAGIEQALDHRGVAIDRREIQRRDVVARRCRGIGVSREQELDEPQVVSLRRPVERGEAVRLRRVDAGPSLEQRAHRLKVLLLDRVDQR
jgi:hypothetical protein